MLQALKKLHLEPEEKVIWTWEVLYLALKKIDGEISK